MASRFLVPGGSGLWADTNNWSATSGGGSGATAPTNNDDVTFDSNSGSANIGITTVFKQVKSFTVTSGYTGTFTNNFGLVISTAGSSVVTLGANMTIAGTSWMVLEGNTITLTANGKAWPGTIYCKNSTYTFADTWTVAELYTNNSSVTATTTLNGGTINVTGNVVCEATTGITNGTTNVVMTGTGTFATSSATTGTFRLNLEINTAGTVTMTTIRYQTGILKYTAGSLTTTSMNLTLAAASTITANASGWTIPNLTISAGNQTFNGTNGFTIGTLAQTVAGGTHTFTSGNTYTVSTLLRINATSASHCSLVASTGSSSFFLNLSGTQALAYCDFTDVDASGGTALYVLTGTLLRTSNITTGSVVGSGAGGGLMCNPVLTGGVI